MENRDYKVCRENIYVGSVVRTNKIYRYEGYTITGAKKPSQLDVFGWRNYRNILFVLDEEKLSSDLLYRSPSYPVLNVTDDEKVLELEGSNIVIKDACNLAKLLEYFGYNKELTYKDLLRIRKTFFTGRFAKDNCELFGWKESQPEDGIYYENGVEITDPKELKWRIAEQRRAQQAGQRSFVGIGTSELPREYWEALDQRGNNKLIDVLSGLENNIDSFKPAKEEGPIKRLKPIRR